VIEEMLLFTEAWTSVLLGIQWFVLSNEL